VNGTASELRDAWDERSSGSDLVWSAAPNRFLAEEVTGLPPGRALDLGAGEGRNAIDVLVRAVRVPEPARG
jgi:hypothetical protein